LHFLWFGTGKRAWVSRPGVYPGDIIFLFIHWTEIGGMVERIECNERERQNREDKHSFNQYVFLDRGIVVNINATFCEIFSSTSIDRSAAKVRQFCRLMSGKLCTPLATKW
jgi:hypothetical protein